MTKTTTSQDLEAQEARKTTDNQYECIYLKNVKHATADHCTVTSDCRERAAVPSLSVQDRN